MSARERCWTVFVMALMGCGMPEIGRSADPAEVLDGTRQVGLVRRHRVPDGGRNRSVPVARDRPVRLRPGRALAAGPEFPEVYQASLEPNRRRLAHILGVRDQRIPFDGLTLVGTTTRPPLVAQSAAFKVFAVSWPVVGTIEGEGLLLVPVEGPPCADVIAIPDADQTPEMLCGLSEGVPENVAVCSDAGRVGVSRLDSDPHRSPTRTAERPRRDDISRVPVSQRIRVGATSDRIRSAEGSGSGGLVGSRAADRESQVTVVGWGEGGMLALYSAALDPRIDVTCVSGYFEPRENIWKTPLDRNVFGLLEQFGDAELASMIAPRTLIVEAAQGPRVVLPPGQGGDRPNWSRPMWPPYGARSNGLRHWCPFGNTSWLQLIVSGEGTGPYLELATLQGTCRTGFERSDPDASDRVATRPAFLSDPPDVQARMQRQVASDRCLQSVAVTRESLCAGRVYEATG